MSSLSRHPVCDTEDLYRFVFQPLHLKKNKILPSLYSQVQDSGCSVQRDFATIEELAHFVRTSLLSDPKRVWLGVVVANCKDIRRITVGGTKSRAVCVYDTAITDGLAHGELFRSSHVEEADIPELRVNLFKAFATHLKPDDFLNGEVWRRLSDDLRARPPGTVPPMPWSA